MCLRDSFDFSINIICTSFWIAQSCDEMKIKKKTLGIESARAAFELYYDDEMSKINDNNTNTE